MRRAMRPIVAAGTLSALVAVAIAGCGGGSENGGPNVVSTPTPGATNAPQSVRVDVGGGVLTDPGVPYGGVNNPEIQYGFGTQPGTGSNGPVVNLPGSGGPVVTPPNAPTTGTGTGGTGTGTGD